MEVEKVGKIIQLADYRLGPERRDESQQKKDFGGEKPSNMRDFSSVFFMARFEMSSVYQSLMWSIKRGQVNILTPDYLKRKEEIESKNPSDQDLINILKKVSMDEIRDDAEYYTIIYYILLDRNPIE